MLLGFLSLMVFLATTALPIGVAALALVWIARGRLSMTAAKLLCAIAFTVGPAYAMWRMEWFDVWSHGVPSVSYIVTTYGPYLLCFAVLGWFSANRLVKATR